MSTTNRQRRAQKQQRRNRQRGSSEQPCASNERLASPDLLEALARDYAARGSLDPHWLHELENVIGIEALFRQLRTSHWAVARERGWDGDLARRALRKLSPALVRGLFDNERLSILEELELLGWLLRLPKLPSIARRTASGDTRMVDRVRALLAKAESTTFPEEAEALTMKAQELITKHCLEEALSAGLADGGPRVAWIIADDPYAEAKSLLIAAVASANRCKAVWFGSFGFASVIGYEADLDAVELIFTSLLVQATRSMTMVGQERAGTRSPSFRRSFIVAFASRIGERLKRAETVAADLVADDRLLPVLAARDSQVESVTDELFPNLKATSISVTNGHGWAAGRSAADHAELTPFDRLHGDAI